MVYFAIKMHRMDNFKTMKIIHQKYDSVLSNQLILKYEKGKFKCTVCKQIQPTDVFISGRFIICQMSTQQLVIPRSVSISYKKKKQGISSTLRSFIVPL